MNVTECKRPDLRHEHADCTNPDRTSVRLICLGCDRRTLMGIYCGECAGKSSCTGDQDAPEGVKA